MTLPFENDTSRIVKKYAKHSISQSRVKTFLSVLTIALAVALLSGFALSVIGMETEAKRELLVSSQMLYHNLNGTRTADPSAGLSGGSPGAASCGAISGGADP